MSWPGEIVKQQEKVAHAGEPGAAAATEWQLFIGNKDVYGIGFRYIDYADILRVSYPPDLLLIERLEYGDAIGVPLALELHGEGTLPATQSRFMARFRRWWLRSTTAGRSFGGWRNTTLAPSMPACRNSACSSVA